MKHSYVGSLSLTMQNSPRRIKQEKFKYNYLVLITNEQEIVLWVWFHFDKVLSRRFQNT